MFYNTVESTKKIEKCYSANYHKSHRKIYVCRIIKSLCLHSFSKFDCKTAKSIDYLITESSKIIVFKRKYKEIAKHFILNENDDDHRIGDSDHVTR